jgi:hypothetical protein
LQSFEAVGNASIEASKTPRDETRGVEQKD